MNKLLFFIKRPCVVVIVGKDCSFATKIISKILKDKNVLILGPETSDFFLKKSKLPILVITDSDDEKEISNIKRLAKIIPAHGFLVLNFDKDQIRDIRNVCVAEYLTYGFYKKADLQISDLNVTSDGTNFKINYQGNIVPFWFKESLEKEHIYSILSAIAVGVVSDINLVEISQSLR
ncbi:hypothetical protein KJ841_01730 [Patescibacteria group bacterium]|nr:hypothetical protein [Patescibacteria group bacterium]